MSKKYETDADAGAALAEYLGLEPDRDGRYYTAGGLKSPLGLFYTVRYFMDEADKEHRDAPPA